MDERWAWTGDDPRPLLRSRQTRLVALDMETTGLDYQDESIGAAIAWRVSSGAMRSTYLHRPYGQLSMDASLIDSGDFIIQEFLADLFAKHQLVFFNEPFDRRALMRITPENPVTFTHDAQHMATLIEYQESRSLRSLHKKYVGTDVPDGYVDMKGKRGKLDKMPLALVADYGRTDAVNTLELLECLLPLLPDKQLYLWERDYAEIIIQMVKRGLRLDSTYCVTRELEFRSRMAEIEVILRERGLKNITNVGVATFLFKVLKLSHDWIPRTKIMTTAWLDGVPSVKDDILEQLPDIPEVELIREWRQLQSGIGKWLRPFRQDARVDGKVHAMLDPFGTVSGRMAAKNPNVQAIPMKSRGAAFGHMKGIFIGDDDDHELWGVDYSQAEARTAAIKAREPGLISVFKSKKDPFVTMAGEIWDAPERRDDAKHATYASIYNVGAAKFAEQYNVSEDHAWEVLRAFRKRFKRIRLASEMAETAAKRNGVVSAYTGRCRYFREGEPTHKAFNQIIQMTVSEIIKQAIFRAAQSFDLRLQVHDSIILHVPKKEREEIIDETKKIMTEAVPAEFREVIDFPVEEELWQ